MRCIINSVALFSVRVPRVTRLKRYSKVIWQVVRWAGLALLLGFVGLYFGRQWDQIRQVELNVKWAVLVASQAVLTFGLGLLPLGGWLVLNDLGVRLPPVTVWHIFYLSNLAKYLPGSIWALPSRALLYNRQGLTRTRSGVVVFWEVLLMVVSAALVSLLAYRLLVLYVPPELVLAGVALLALLLVVVMLPPTRRWLGSRLARFDAGLSTGGLVRALAVYMLSWGVMGVAFAGMIASVAPQFDAGWTVELVGLFTGSWLVGFLAIFAPGGIGVRDFLLVLGVSVLLNDPLPAVVAVIARLMWTLAEVAGLGLVQLWQYSLQRQTGKQEIRS